MMSYLSEPIEKTKEFKKIVKKVDKEVEEILEARGERKGFGYCHSFWPEKKRLLREKYNIEWKTPIEMNPYVIFD
jgi:hypothetical protein